MRIKWLATFLGQYTESKNPVWQVLPNFHTWGTFGIKELVGSSYISAKVEYMLNKKLSVKRIEMLMGARLTIVEKYDLDVQSLDSSLKMDARLTKVDKNELSSIGNPNWDSSSRRPKTKLTNKRFFSTH